MGELCPVNPKPMLEWVQGQSDSCRPCLLTPILPWYRDTLRERGYGELASQVDAWANRDDALDPEAVARVLDAAKAGVDAETACTLAQYDSLAQDAELEIGNSGSDSPEEGVDHG